MKIAQAGGFDFGFTSDKTRLKAARQYRLDALADGWIEEKPEHSKDPLNQYSHLSRDTGWKMHVMARINPEGSTSKYQCSVDVWGPDGLVVRTPNVYSREELKRGVKHCNVCGADNVKTQRYSFAGRGCKSCCEKPEQRNIFMG